MRKSRIFIASSAEALSIARAINVNFDHDLEATIWTNGAFRLSSSVVPDLLELSSRVDFALFVFTPDDIAQIRDREYAVVRDNVIFELGLFIGAIGQDRSFIIQPRGVELHLPSDLVGITTTDYDPERSDGNLFSATDRACTLIREEIKKKGLIDRERLSSATRIVANPTDYELSHIDYLLLAICLQSRTMSTSGASFNEIKNKLKGCSEMKLQISAVRLQRMGLIEIELTPHEYENYDYLAYRVTEAGIDEVLSNESEIPDQITPDTKAVSSAVDLDDEVPF